MSDSTHPMFDKQEIYDLLASRSVWHEVIEYRHHVHEDPRPYRYSHRVRLYCAYRRAVKSRRARL